MRRILILWLTLLLVPSALAAKAPNVIVFLADDLGAGDVSPGEDRPIQTPAIDGIAKRGVTMTQGYASANVCSPSRAGLLTGRYPIRSGLAFDVIQAQDTRGLPQDEVTLPELLRDAGYATGMVGKWHLGVQAEYWPTKHGFDEFFGVPHSNDMPDFVLYEGEESVQAPAEQTALTRRFTVRAVDFIRRNESRPFFLYVAYTAPHIPLFASEAFAGQSKAGRYGDVVEELDWSVGEIRKAVDEIGALENTIVVFTSDNGPWFEGDAGLLRGTKGNTYDGGYRVPLIWSWPKSWPSGSRRSALTSHLDVLPTIAAAAGLALPEDLTIDGRDLNPVLRGERRQVHDEFVYFDNEDVVGVRDDRWKLLHRTYYRRSMGALDKFSQIAGFDSDYPLLFDMYAPSPERYSLASRHPDVLARLTARLNQRRTEFEALRTREPRETYPR